MKKYTVITSLGGIHILHVSCCRRTNRQVIFYNKNGEEIAYFANINSIRLHEEPVNKNPD